MERNDYTEANRRVWDEIAPRHREQRFDELRAQFAKPGFSLLDPVERAILERLGIAGRSVAQLCCNNGRELLSVRNLGAGHCVGFDISREFIAQACELASAGGRGDDRDTEFVCCDVYEVPSRFNGEFDLAYVTIGALGWMPDLDRFFAVAARLLRPGGHVFVYEQHPIVDMFETPPSGPELKNSYFRKEPFTQRGGIDYYGDGSFGSEENYWFHHKLSDVFSACLKNALAIVSFKEYGHDISNVFAWAEKLAARPPLSYTLVCKRLAP